MSLPENEIAIPQKEVYTYDDYALLPEGAPYQLIGGKLVMTPAPSTFHQIICARIQGKLYNHVNEKDLGLVLFSPIDVYFEEKETYQPDIIFIAKDRLHIIKSAKVTGAPDLVVEILSPSTGYYDLKKKARIYAKHGVKEYWIADPEDTSIEVHTGQGGRFVLNQRVEGEGRVRSLILEGFEVQVKDIFAPLDVVTEPGTTAAPR
ncbi:Uma2 family endonuclease [Desulfofundulus thermobenzoicus]|uniref:Uma2 family endonuclease n=1 Tax=Desulfofundulus thermobenzoicus TaxID=29376 RepID=A0A6N7IPM3_9FIRM|nr:Uma2 family endonuclease [Desulfofundulus thermobenzoicus]MQL51972.1 Uma2 family endonuclease [Desulfofundulus thermobenzoicus]